ncbi:MAG TPA: glycosyltransferase [Actinomycetota bacterium]|nr:glycosyltransferase [Actinomycetota bacterium]
MKVTLISTVKDAAEHVGPFLDSVRAQTRPPDEVVIVDGGSTDGTLEILRSEEGIVVLHEPGANISRGRNLAIARASHDVLACSDADCVLDPRWLEELLRPIEAGADVAMGVTEPIVEGFLQACLACVNLPGPEELDEATFMPSSRSVAYRRSAIEAAGGYPEWLDVGEDMFVDHRFRELGLDLRLARGAVARWRLRPDLRSTFRQYFRYAWGDAVAGMHPERHAIRLATYGGLLYAWGSRSRLLKLATVAGGLAYARAPLARAARRFPTAGERALAAIAIPALMAYLDLAKLAGYLAGLGAARRRGQPAGYS